MAMTHIRHVPRNTLRLVRGLFRNPKVKDEALDAEAALLRQSPIQRGEMHTLPGRLILSLTSHPPRFPDLDLVLKMLLSQNMSPDLVVLWIAHNDIASLPACVRDLQQHGLTIRECNDVRSFTKLVPALQAYPDAFIVTADDDMRYPAGWLRRFVAEYRSPNEILCQGARRITFRADGRLAAYRKWPRIRGEESGPAVFPLGVRGILYPPRSLSPETCDAATFMRLCPHGDDLWFYWMGARSGSTRRVIVPSDPITEWPSSRNSNLWRQNMNGGNDKQIAALTTAYGLPYQT